MMTLRLTDRQPRSRAPSAGKYLDKPKTYYAFLPGDVWNPNVNLYENENAYLVCVDLAGVDKEKIEIDVTPGRLTLRGQRAVPSLADSGLVEPGADHNSRVRMHLMEIDHGAFAREVEVPQNVNNQNINAKYVNGMLWIVLPKLSR